jgi:hypothetical protein
VVESGPAEPQRLDPDYEYVVVGTDDEVLGRWVAPSTPPLAPVVQFAGADERAAYLVGLFGLEIGLVALDRGGEPRELFPNTSFAPLDARLRVAMGAIDDTLVLRPAQPPE